MAKIKEERIVKDTATLAIYDYIDNELGINQKSRIRYKKKDLIVHFPRAFEGGQKYKTIEKFSYLGFKGKLPVGVNKSVTFGYGFTKRLWPFAQFVNDNFKFKEVVIEKDGKTKIDLPEKKLYLNQKALQKLNDSFDSIFRKNKSDVDVVLNNVLFDLFPKDVEKPEASYIPNTISISLLSWGNHLTNFQLKTKRQLLSYLRAFH